MKNYFTYLCRRATRIALFVCALMIGGGVSAWAESYTCGFESSEGWSAEKIGFTYYTTCGEGWGVKGDGTSTLLKNYVLSENIINGSQSLGARTNSSFYVVTPKLSAGEISFNAKQNGGSSPIKIYKATFDGTEYTLSGDPFVSLSITSSSDCKSFDLDEASYLAILLNNNIIDDFCASNGLALETTINKPTSFIASPTSFSTASLSWNAGGVETQWQIKYNNGADFDPDNEGTQVSEYPTDDNPYTLTGLEAETTYYVYIRTYVDESSQSDWVGTSFTTPEQYPTPTDFALDGFTATTATFSWNNGVGTTANAWQIKYSTTQGFNPDNAGVLVDGIDSNPYILENLTEGTTYYARLRADYGSSHYSSWNTTEIEFTPAYTVHTLVNNGTDKSYNIPIPGSFVNNSMVKSQFVIPSSSLSGIKDRQITKLTFYAGNSSISWGTATFEVYLREVDYTTFSSSSFESWGTNVFNSASLSVIENEMIINLDTPFNYSGGNLQIGIMQTRTGSSSSSDWLSVKEGNYSNYVAIYGTGTGTVTRTYYAPKVTITSIPISTAPVKLDNNGYTTFASPWSLDLTAANLPSGLNAYKAETVDGTTVHFTPINSTVQANTGILLEGTANTTYEIPVVASGSNISGSNQFLVNSTGGTFSPDGSYTYFGLLKNTSPLTFGTFAPGSVAIPSNKAYLKVLTSSLPASSRLTCVFDNDTEGIQGVKQDALASDVYYNLAGQRVNAPTKGLYIVNGKKVIIK